MSTKCNVGSVSLFECKMSRMSFGQITVWKVIWPKSSWLETWSYFQFQLPYLTFHVGGEMLWWDGKKAPVYHERHINVECVMLPIRTSGSTSNSNDICFKFIWGWYHLISSSVLNIFANKINRIGSNKTELEEMSWLFTPTWGPWCHTLVFFTCHSTGVIPPLSFTLYCSPPFVHLINLTNSVKCQLRAIQTECQITMWMKL